MNPSDLTKENAKAFIEKVKEDGLVIDRETTGRAIAREFGVTNWAGRQVVDLYLGGEL